MTSAITIVVLYTAPSSTFLNVPQRSSKAEVTDLHRDTLDRTQHSYEQLVLAHLGPRPYQAASLCILLGQFGGLVAFLVVLLDLGVPVVRVFLPWA